MDGNPADPRGSNGISAYAQIGGLEIAYAREGRGTPLILLAEPRLHGAVLPEMSANYCVISPRHPWKDVARGAEPLRGFIEALGLVQPVVVVQGAWAAAPLSLGLEDAEVLVSLVILCDGQCTCPWPMMDAWKIRGDSTPLLHARVTQDASGVLQAASAREFLRQRGVAIAGKL